MHADIHHQLHALTAAELHRAADRSVDLPRTPAPPLRVQIGWRLVELGLRLATPADRRPVTLAA
ncbi:MULTISPECIES: hypothetical protein [Streptomyces]|uniref:hypothetical protein n=1 Tax=Streptomyces TaxID=1883 RepID=UPI00093B9234|nr:MULTISPECIES: hypothetical protein [Streptomyces]MBX9424972.1 hypothetical protein [Streptomyces lateritius]OKJ69745.1 hypothetical protein AMK29_05000 [Streptomyces sp. CB02261]